MSFRNTYLGFGVYSKMKGKHPSAAFARWNLPSTLFQMIQNLVGDQPPHRAVPRAPSLLRNLLNNVTSACGTYTDDPALQGQEHASVAMLCTHHHAPLVPSAEPQMCSWSCNVQSPVDHSGGGWSSLFGLLVCFIWFLRLLFIYVYFHFVTGISTFHVLAYWCHLIEY